MLHVQPRACVVSGSSRSCSGRLLTRQLGPSCGLLRHPHGLSRRSFWRPCGQAEQRSSAATAANFSANEQSAITLSRLFRKIDTTGHQVALLLHLRREQLETEKLGAMSARESSEVGTGDVEGTTSPPASQNPSIATKTAVLLQRLDRLCTQAAQLCESAAVEVPSQTASAPTTPSSALSPGSPPSPPSSASVASSSSSSFSSPAMEAQHGGQGAASFNAPIGDGDEVAGRQAEAGRARTVATAALLVRAQALRRLRSDVAAALADPENPAAALGLQRQLRLCAFAATPQIPDASLTPLPPALTPAAAPERPAEALLASTAVPASEDPPKPESAVPPEQPAVKATTTGPDAIQPAASSLTEPSAYPTASAPLTSPGLLSTGTSSSSPASSSSMPQSPSQTGSSTGSGPDSEGCRNAGGGQDARPKEEAPKSFRVHSRATPFTWDCGAGTGTGSNGTGADGNVDRGDAPDSTLDTLWTSYVMVAASFLLPPFLGRMVRLFAYGALTAGMAGELVQVVRGARRGPKFPPRD